MLTYFAYTCSSHTGSLFPIRLLTSLIYNMDDKPIVSYLLISAKNIKVNGGEFLDHNVP